MMASKDKEVTVEKASLPTHKYAEPWNRSDVILSVEDNNLHVHSIILSLASPVFATMLKPGFKEGNEKKVELKHKRKEAVIKMLDLIYPTEYIEHESINCEELLPLVREYDIKKLYGIIDTYISRMVKTDEFKSKTDRYLLLMKFLKMSEQFSLNKTTEAVFPTLLAYRDAEAFKTDDYKDLSPELKLRILIEKVKLHKKRCAHAHLYPDLIEIISEG